MELSCVYIPEINEQKEDILIAFRDIAKIEHVEFVSHNRYARVVNGRNNSQEPDYTNDSVNGNVNGKSKTKTKRMFGLNLSFKRKPKRVAYLYIQEWYDLNFCLKVLKRDAYLGKWQILPNENSYQIELYKLKKRVLSLENRITMQDTNIDQFNADNEMIESLTNLLLENKLETQQTIDDSWIQYEKTSCDDTLTYEQNYMAYMKQRLQSIL